MAKSKVIPIVGVVVGIVLLITITVVGWAAYPKIKENTIKGKTRLVEEASTYEKWRKIETPIDFKFYIFNLTNPDANLTANEKLVFDELGPFVFSKESEKQKIERQGDVLIRYRQNTSYYFNAEKSNGTLDMVITIPNVPYITVTSLLFALVPNQIQANVRALINRIHDFDGEEIFKRDITVGQMLFEGWPLAVKPFSGWLGVKDILDTFDPTAFGFYRGENNSLGEEYTVHTGAADSDLFGNIVAFNKLTELDTWYTPGLAEDSNMHMCNKLNGTDGTVYPPFQTKERDLQIFSSDVCRSLTLKFDREIEHFKIPGYRYKLPENLFDHPDVMPENSCYCRILSTRLDRRCFAGAFRLFPCKSAPLIGSLPHFLRGEGLLENITITPPVVDDHETFIEIEPETGALLRARKRIQVGVELDRIPQAGYSVFSDLPNRGASWIMPLFWVEESADMDQETADELYSLLIQTEKTVNIVRWVGLGVSIAITLVSGYFTLRAF